MTDEYVHGRLGLSEDVRSARKTRICLTNKFNHSVDSGFLISSKNIRKFSTLFLDYFIHTFYKYVHERLGLCFELKMFTFKRNTYFLNKKSKSI